MPPPDERSGHPPPLSIGGFLGLEIAGAGSEPGAAFDAGDHLFFRNARAAFAHLLAVLDAPRVWLPAYICPEMATAAAGAGRVVLFYPVGRTFEADVAFLEGRLRARDAVVGVDYFGAADPTGAFATLAPRFPNVHWVQDRAQALWPSATAPWGDYLLYSPRKVVGVADGGALVSRRGPLRLPTWMESTPVDGLYPALMRLEDPQGHRREVWFPAYQKAEAEMNAEPVAMSRLSSGLLGRFDTTALADRRRANAAALLSRISARAPIAADRLLVGSPLGVPVLTKDAAATASAMAARGVYCARHWASLPSDASQFPQEHALSRELLTLPCDHRYGVDDMLRIIEVLELCDG